MDELGLLSQHARRIWLMVMPCVEKRRKTCSASAQHTGQARVQSLHARMKHGWGIAMRVVARREELTLRVCEHGPRRGFSGHVLRSGTQPGSQTAGGLRNDAPPRNYSLLSRQNLM